MTTKPRVLTLDIERLPGRAEVDFWDLGDYKNRRIHADSVTEWPRTICAAWRWRGEKKIGFVAEWNENDDLSLKMHELYDEADVVVGHNIDGFDTQKLASGWLERGLSSPSPWKSIDTLKVARQRFGFESNTLNALCERLGITAKVDRYDPRVARAACEGNVPAQRRIKRYNMGDIVATEALLERLEGWQKNPPNMNLWSGDDELRCVACGSTNLQRRGEQVALAQVYDRVQCQDCGTWGRGTEIIRRAAGVRNA
jgi:hypothetical protein